MSSCVAADQPSGSGSGFLFLRLSRERLPRFADKWRLWDRLSIHPTETKYTTLANTSAPVNNEPELFTNVCPQSAVPTLQQKT